jgi:hypothetical protein
MKSICPEDIITESDTKKRSSHFPVFEQAPFMWLLLLLLLSQHLAELYHLPHRQASSKEYHPQHR